MSEVKIESEKLATNGHAHPILVSNYAESEVVKVLKEDVSQLRMQFRVALGMILVMLFGLTYLTVYLFWITH